MRTRARWWLVLEMLLIAAFQSIGSDKVALPIGECCVCESLEGIFLINEITSDGGGCWGFTTVPVTKTIRLSEWVTPGDTAIPGMTSLKDGDLQHSSALAQSPKEI